MITETYMINNAITVKSFQSKKQKSEFELEGNKPIEIEIAEPTELEVLLSKISSLESKQTPRRLREAALGDADSIAFLQDIDDQISELRKSLSD